MLKYSSLWTLRTTLEELNGANTELLEETANLQAQIDVLRDSAQSHETIQSQLDAMHLELDSLRQGSTQLLGTAEN